jgi:hypothetical protein
MFKRLVNLVIKQNYSALDYKIIRLASILLLIICWFSDKELSVAILSLYTSSRTLIYAAEDGVPSDKLASCFYASIICIPSSLICLIIKCYIPDLIITESWVILFLDNLICISFLVSTWVSIKSQLSKKER